LLDVDQDQHAFLAVLFDCAKAMMWLAGTTLENSGMACKPRRSRERGPRPRNDRICTPWLRRYRATTSSATPENLGQRSLIVG